MFIHILGSCSGTEPMPGRDYTSWILEEDCGDILWFDAGGACSAHAYRKGLDPLKAKALFLSHPHGDHTGGLQGIMGIISKAKWLRNDPDIFRKLPCYTAVPEVIEAAHKLCCLSSQKDCWEITPEIHLIETPGEIFSDAGIAVDTLPNLHMRLHPETGRHQSWSFRIRRRKNGEAIVYTGDVKSLDELAAWLETPTRLLMLETGHHRADELCKMIRERNWPIEELLFVHHGLEILRDPAGEKAKADAVWGKPVLFADDGMTLAFR
jgi:ribonuclease BN (tRNA processing enzyme)